MGLVGRSASYAAVGVAETSTSATVDDERFRPALEIHSQDVNVPPLLPHS